jgi:hypothetical protein
MGMNYNFYPPPSKDNTKDIFPSNFGWFSERVGAFDEYSEFKQLEKILNIDLTLLNSCEYDSDDFCSTITTTVKNFENLIKEFISRVNENPNFHASIDYQDNRAELCRQYLESGELIKDLSEFLRIMELYKKNNIKEFQINYI